MTVMDQVALNLDTEVKRRTSPPSPISAHTSETVGL